MNGSFQPVWLRFAVIGAAIVGVDRCRGRCSASLPRPVADAGTPAVEAPVDGDRDAGVS